MTWTVKVIKDGNGTSHKVSVEYSSYSEDRILLTTEANSLANQLLIAAAEARRLNNPPKKFY